MTLLRSFSVDIPMKLIIFPLGKYKISGLVFKLINLLELLIYLSKMKNLTDNSKNITLFYTVKVINTVIIN